MLLLSLLGEQPIPNLLPLWQFPHFTATCFAATHRTLPVAGDLKKAVLRDPQLRSRQVLDPLILDAYDLPQARAELARRLAEIKPGQACLNLTGGTKIMSLAALQAAADTHTDWMYVSSETNQFLFYHWDGQPQKSRPIQVKISVAQYLTAHGLDVSDHPAFFRGSQPRRPDTPSEGDWLEELVYQKALASGLFDDVRRNIFIRKQTIQGGVKNELDVVVTCNGRLAVCSCKDRSSVTKEFIYELSSLSRREAAGIYCGKVLVTGLPDVRPAIRERALAAGIRLVCRSDLENVAQELLTALR